MRSIWLAAFLALGAFGCSAEASAQEPRFQVPRIDRAPDFDRGPDMILPPDIVARPGEDPSEALSRALRTPGSASTGRRCPEVAK